MELSLKVAGEASENARNPQLFGVFVRYFDPESIFNFFLKSCLENLTHSFMTISFNSLLQVSYMNKKKKPFFCCRTKMKKNNKNMFNFLNNI